jgi:membrane protein YqaA with SNARE-associated domain
LRNLVSSGKNIILAIWAFLESIVWFIAADYILFLYGVREPYQWRRHLGIVASMSLAGIITHFVLLSFFPDLMESLLRATPFVQPWMFDNVSALLNDSIWFAVVQPFTLIAVKVWTYTVATSPTSVYPFLVLVMIGRVMRWGVVVAFAKGVNWFGGDYVEDNYWVIVVTWTLLFAAIMILGEL